MTKPNTQLTGDIVRDLRDVVSRAFATLNSQDQHAMIKRASGNFIGVLSPAVVRARLYISNRLCVYYGDDTDTPLNEYIADYNTGNVELPRPLRIEDAYVITGVTLDKDFKPRAAKFFRDWNHGRGDSTPKADWTTSVKGADYFADFDTAEKYAEPVRKTAKRGRKVEVAKAGGFTRK